LGNVHLQWIPPSLFLLLVGLILLLIDPSETIDDLLSLVEVARIMNLQSVRLHHVALVAVASILDDFVVRVVLGLDLGLGARALLVVGWHFVNGSRLLVMIEVGFTCRDCWFWMGRVLRGGRSVESPLMGVPMRVDEGLRKSVG
jgi:hypothetical protein